MPRTVTTYVCQNCGAQSRQFFGRCSSCGSWNSLVEQSSGPPPDGRRRRQSAPAAEPAPRRSEAMAAVGERAVQRLTGEQADWFGLDTGRFLTARP